MICIIWEFHVKPKHREVFEKTYGPEGLWAQLFRKDPRYKRTELLQSSSDPLRYRTHDVWESKEAFEEFHRTYQREYEMLDSDCTGYTSSEHNLGMINMV